MVKLLHTCSKIPPHRNKATMCRKLARRATQENNEVWLFEPNVLARNFESKHSFQLIQTFGKRLSLSMFVMSVMPLQDFWSSEDMS